MSLEPHTASVMGVLAALSEGQRAIAHLVVPLAVLVAAGLVYLIRRMRRRDQTRETQGIPE
jgi:mannose/fructose/N-acetylgalactosamine-specific phosphotransferase system component IIC